jgi:hypothetical protein
MVHSGTELRDTLFRQFEMGWALASYHLSGLTTEECLWRPAEKGLHIHETADGHWQADWPDHEGYDLGPSSIGWLTWHFGFWWSMVINHSFEEGQLAREAISWPGSAEELRAGLDRLQTRWRKELQQLSDDDLRSTQRSRWPLQNCPFGDIVAWVNIELTKNAAEIGYARFLYTQR